MFCLEEDDQVIIPGWAPSNHLFCYSNELYLRDLSIDCLHIVKHLENIYFNYFRINFDFKNENGNEEHEANKENEDWRNLTSFYVFQLFH